MARHDRQEAQSSTGGVDANLARHGGLSYLEIPALEAQRSAAFYQNVLGWKVEGGDTGHPKFADQTGHLIGRWVTSRAAAEDRGVLPYIYVNRIDDAVKRVVAYGGEVVKAPYVEGNLWVSTVRDPAGNVIGLWQER